MTAWPRRARNPLREDPRKARPWARTPSRAGPPRSTGASPSCRAGRGSTPRFRLSIARIVGGEAGRDRQEVGVRGREVAEQVGAVRVPNSPRVSRQRAVKPFDIGQDIRLVPLARVVRADVHRHRRAQCRVAGVEVRYQGPGAGPGPVVGGPDAAVGMEVVEPLDDRHRVERREALAGFALPEHRHQTRRGQGVDVRLPVLRVELQHPFGERDAEFGHERPRPERPGRVVLVADDEGEWLRHGGGG